MLKYQGVEVLFTTFPNGETKFVHESIAEAIFNTNDTGLVSFRYENDSDLIKLMFLKKYLDRQSNIRRIVLDIYYMMYSRMDRSEDGSAFTLEYVAEFINQLKFDKVYLNEPHSDVSGELIDNSYEFFITPKLFTKAIDELGISDADYVMFPDEGARKRYEKKFRLNNIVTGVKVRDFKTGRITDLKLEGNLKNVTSESRAFICDDLSSYGGTFVRSAKELKEAGFKEVYLIVTHAENAVFDGELFDHIEKLFTTDSILSKHTLPENQKFTDRLMVYPMEEL